MNYQVSNIHFVCLMFDGRLGVYGNACQISRSCMQMHVVLPVHSLLPCTILLLAWIDYFFMLLIIIALIGTDACMYNLGCHYQSFNACTDAAHELPVLSNI